MSRTVVLLRPLGLGGFLTGVPAYRAIARAFPNHRVLLAAPRELQALVRLCGAIDDTIDTQPRDPLNARLQQADLAVDLQGKGPRSHRVLLDSKPCELFAFANAEVPESASGPPWDENEHEVARWCRMLRWFGIAETESDLYLDVPADPRFAGSVIVHPGASAESRRWPLARWVATIAKLRKRGAPVVLTGSHRELERCLRIADAADVPRERVLAGELDLAQLASTVASASAVICGDTGIAHLATATTTPSIVLFGPTPPSLWGPPQLSMHRVIWYGGTGDPHGDVIDPSLRAITVDDVLRQFDALFASHAIAETG
ncbi:MAG TPA: glycosyltransferase family 9 protein [Candidatus Tumulicola sp.]|jgi:ADP-heptose:LPS heptosyltransferase